MNAWSPSWPFATATGIAGLPSGLASSRQLALHDCTGEVRRRVANLNVADEPGSSHHNSRRRRPDYDLIRCDKRLNALLDTDEIEPAIHRVRIETLSWLAHSVGRAIISNYPFGHTYRSLWLLAPSIFVQCEAVGSMTMSATRQSSYGADGSLTSAGGLS